MQPITLMRCTKLLMTMVLMAITSCESEDRRLAEYAQRAAQEQARQNERMAQQAASIARQSQEVTEAAHDLVAQDAAARRDLIQAQDKLQQQNQAERSTLDSQRQQLDIERKTALQAAVRAPVVAQAIITAGFIMAALLPLLVTLYALRRIPVPRPVDELLGDALLESLVTVNPAGLPSGRVPSRLPDAAAAFLEGPSGGPPAGSGRRS